MHAEDRLSTSSRVVPQRACGSPARTDWPKSGFGAMFPWHGEEVGRELSDAGHSRLATW